VLGNQYSFSINARLTTFSALTVTTITYGWPPNHMEWLMKSCYARTFILAFQIPYFWLCQSDAGTIACWFCLAQWGLSRSQCLVCVSSLLNPCYFPAYNIRITPEGGETEDVCGITPEGGETEDVCGGRGHAISLIVWQGCLWMGHTVATMCFAISATSAGVGFFSLSFLWVLHHSVRVCQIVVSHFCEDVWEPGLDQNG
jgi:hypothetical protein